MSHLTVHDLIPGEHRIKVDESSDPVSGEMVSSYEQVIMVEDVGRCYKIHTTHNTVLVESSTDVEVMDEE